MLKTRLVLFILLNILLLLFGCDSNSKIIKIDSKNLIETSHEKPITPEKQITFSGNDKTIHIFVALCDNKYQGIVPVPNSIGNGQEPKSNLYWGAAYGISTYFKRSKDWKLLNTKNNISDTLLQRLVFKHKKLSYYIVADAYNGKYIKQTTIDFLKSASGIKKDTIILNKKTIGTNGNSNLIAYIGHNGLMDFDLPNLYKNIDGQKRDAIMLACISKDYFSEKLQDAQANPLVWTTGLMAPEAYTIHDALNAYVSNKTEENIRLQAAKAYSKYQKCSLRAANSLLVKGF